MIHVKHSGIYVRNLERETVFYREVFGMLPVCEGIEQQDALTEDILGGSKESIRISKLITERGKETGIGDMLELLYTEAGKDGADSRFTDVYTPGCMHISFGVHAIERVAEKVKEWGGTQETAIHELGKNKCCFCRDPEGNWLELIENL